MNDSIPSTPLEPTDERTCKEVLDKYWGELPSGVKQPGAEPTSGVVYDDFYGEDHFERRTQPFGAPVLTDRTAHYDVLTAPGEDGDDHELTTTTT